MIKKILLVFLSVIIGGVFVFSALAKLYPVEPFEYTFVEMGVSGWKLSPFVARVFIAVELFIGVLFILNIKTSLNCKVAFAVLMLFTLYLSALLLSGNTGNCGCFGDYLQMTPLQAIIKNLCLSGLIFVIYKNHRGLVFKPGKYVTAALLPASLAMPFILNPVDLDYSEAYLSRHESFYRLRLDTLYKNAYYHTPGKGLASGKHIISFLSLGCPHCRVAAKKIKLMKESDPLLPFYFVLNGKEERLDDFFKDTKAVNIPFCMLKARSFTYLAGTKLPAIYLVNNDTVENSLDYFHLDQAELQKWLQK